MLQKVCYHEPTAIGLLLFDSAFVLLYSDLFSLYDVTNESLTEACFNLLSTILA